VAAIFLCGQIVDTFPRLPCLSALTARRRDSAKGKWIYVRYFDYIGGEPKAGWVMKKYLKRIQK
jgi:hypothetical protein